MRKIKPLASLAVIVALLTSSLAAQVDVCKALLANGVFDTRQDQTKYTSYNNHRSFYCSAAASDYGSAKALDAFATVPIDDVLVGFGLKANASDYNKWRSQLCSSDESLYTSDYWSTARAITASGKLLEEFNKCITNSREGLIQYISIPSNDSKLFSWTFVYHPDGPTLTADVTPTPSNATCGLSPGETLKVGPTGKTLNCVRTSCDGAVLVLNASRTPHPSTLLLPAISLQPDPPLPAPHFVSIDIPMNRPIADPLPGVTPDEKCEFSNGTGNWNAGPNGALPFSCANYPQPTVKNGVAAGDFDSYYPDNSGTCHFTFKCWPEPISEHRVLPNWCAK